MGKIILITEKPSVAQEYRKVLGVRSEGKTDGYVEGYSDFLKSDIQITWAVGHLIELGSVDEQKEGKMLPKTHKGSGWKQENYPYFPSKWFYKPSYATKKQFDVIKELYKQKDIDTIYYAGDSGREGIYIQALIRNQVFGKDGSDVTLPKNVKSEKVVWIDSYTDESIKNGIREAKDYADYKPMIEAGYERAKTDWLIGMNFSPAYTIKNRIGVIAVGRVMTPVLDMVVRRQKEIEDFKPTDYFGIKAGTDLEPVWKAVKGTPNFESDLLYNESGFKNRKDAEALVSDLDKDMHLSVKDIKVEDKKEYAPLLFNLADLQAWCSKNYKISPNKTLEVAQSLYEKKMTTYPRTDARVLSSAVAKELAGRGYKVPPKYVDDSKITDHYAIIPTGLKASLTDLEQKVYDDISNRFEAIFKPPYVYKAVSVTYEHKNKEQFFASGKSTIDLGWKALYNEKPVTFSTDLKKGDVVSVKSFDLKPMQTKAPSAYTTGTMILAMEKAGRPIEDEELREQIKTCGIGTSATRAGIIEKLKDKEYITIDKSQKIAPTANGRAIVEAIRYYDETILSPEKTAEMEQKLSDIASGSLPVTAYEEYSHGYIETVVGTVFSGTKSFSGTGNASKGTGAGTASKKGSTGTGSTTAGTDTSGKEYKCPSCGKTLRCGQYGWYCTDKDFSLGSEICGYKTTEKDLESLLAKGETAEHEFTWKSGKKGKAKLVWNRASKKTEFEFTK